MTADQRPDGVVRTAGTAPRLRRRPRPRPSSTADDRHHLGAGAAAAARRPAHGVRRRRARGGPAASATTLEPDGDIVAVPGARRRRSRSAFALVKGERPELVVQKLTELGVDRIVPFVAERSVVRWDDATLGRQAERLRARGPRGGHAVPAVPPARAGATRPTFAAVAGAARRRPRPSVAARRSIAGHADGARRARGRVDRRRSGARLPATVGLRPARAAVRDGGDRRGRRAWRALRAGVVSRGSTPALAPTVGSGRGVAGHECPSETGHDPVVGV